MQNLTDRQRLMLDYWLSALAAGSIAWLAFTLVGRTPLIRATGLALVIVGITLTLRHWGRTLAISGALALAFCPAFWSQTGGGASSSPAAIIAGLGAAGAGAALFVRYSRRPYLALGLGLLIFALIFSIEVGTPRSLRLTGLLTAWLIYLLVDALLTANPRPEEALPAPIEAQHYLGMLLILCVGVLNDPLFVLLAPGVSIGLWLCHTPLPRWYWLVLGGVVAAGLVNMAGAYLDDAWWHYPSLQAQREGIQVPYILADGWRQGARWVNLIGLVVDQFTVAGAALSVLGLARMARWYPVLGIVSMLAYGFYAIFGLVYFGADRVVLLMPLFIIQIIWLTYAAHTLGQWLNKSLEHRLHGAHRLVTAAFIALPAYLFLLVSG